MKKAKKTVRKLDIFVLLEAFDLNDLSVYDQIAADPEALKEFKKEIGYMLPMWMTGSARDADHRKLIEKFNRNCNRCWFDFAKNPRMQAKLLATVGLGRATPHRFHRVRAVRKQNPLMDLLLLQHPDIRKDEVDLWLRKHTLGQAEELAQMFGWQSEQIDDLRKYCSENGKK